MDKKEYIAVLALAKNEESCYLVVDVNTEFWDSMTPQDRYEDILERALAETGGHMNVRHFQIIAGADGKFERLYSPVLTNREFGVHLDLQEMLDAEILNLKWIAKGYKSKEQMHEYEGDDEEWEEDDEEENAEA